MICQKVQPILGLKLVVATRGATKFGRRQLWQQTDVAQGRKAIMLPREGKGQQ